MASEGDHPGDLLGGRGISSRSSRDEVADAAQQRNLVAMQDAAAIVIEGLQGEVTSLEARLRAAEATNESQAVELDRMRVRVAAADGWEADLADAKQAAEAGAEREQALLDRVLDLERQLRDESRRRAVAEAEVVRLRASPSDGPGRGAGGHDELDVRLEGGAGDPELASKFAALERNYTVRCPGGLCRLGARVVCVCVCVRLCVCVWGVSPQ